MKNFINSLNKTEKRILSALLIWTCINLFFLASGIATLGKKGTFLVKKTIIEGPFGDYTEPTYGKPGEYLFLIQSEKIAAYDFSEFFLYVLGAWAVFVSYKYLWK